MEATIKKARQVTMRGLFPALRVTNPKRQANCQPSEPLFPYYAGYSKGFVEELLRSVVLSKESITVDPWSGAGTTVHALQKLGLQGLGLDLNPVMVVASKAGLLSALERPSLIPLAQSIVDTALQDGVSMGEKDPLNVWLCANNAAGVRQLESAVNKTLISHMHYQQLNTKEVLDQVSPLAAFFYVALFRAIRRILRTFVPTNPTWIKRPSVPQEKKRPPIAAINNAFVAEVRQLSLGMNPHVSSTEDLNVKIVLASSEAIPRPVSSVDLVVGSPPYCTRIDYAIATAIELAILRYGDETFDALRRNLMGTSTVPGREVEPDRGWGRTCNKFLGQLYSHRSKASKTYYFKNHVQYFQSLYRSIQDVARILRPRGGCILVLQDSHYKEIYNNVPQIAKEMAFESGLILRRECRFISTRSMVRVNRRAKQYLRSRKNVEAVLCFERV